MIFIGCVVTYPNSQPNPLYTPEFYQLFTPQEPGWPDQVVNLWNTIGQEKGSGVIVIDDRLLIVFND
jgi:hypothetical protein